MGHTQPDPSRPSGSGGSAQRSLDPHEFYPPAADRDVETVWPEEGVEMDVETLLRAKGVDPDDVDWA